LNSQSGLRHPAADTGMQREYERQQCEERLIHDITLILCLAPGNRGCIGERIRTKKSSAENDWPLGCCSPLGICELFEQAQQ
jgi:hypothetical protein